MLNGEAQRLTRAAEASGWVFRDDDALGARWRDNRGDDLAHALRDVSTSLASMGVTGVTDASGSGAGTGTAVRSGSSAALCTG